MARIRKIHRTIKTTKVNSQENSESETDKNSTKSSRFNVPNGRKISFIEKNRRVLQNLRNYTGYFENLTITNKKCLSCSILSTIRGRNCAHSNSKSTQTSENEIQVTVLRKIASCSTQTEPIMKIENMIHRTRSDITLFTSPCSFKRQYHNFTSVRNYIDCENDDTKEMSSYGKLSPRNDQVKSSKTLITLHTNEKIYNNNKTTPSRIPIPLKYSQKTKTEENKLRKKKRSLFAKKKSRKSMHSNNFRNSVETIKQGDNLQYTSNSECKLSVYDELINKMKIYSEITSEWSLRMFKIFSDLGISLKKSLNNIYKLYEAQSFQSFTFCECDKYRQEVNRVMSKMNELELHVKSLSAKAGDKCENVEEAQEISRKLDKISADVESFAALKTEVENLKKQVESGARSATTCMTSLPPPPPPPMPPPPISCHSTSFIRVVRDERKLSRFDNSRPIITLEDILKVKLKKISVTEI